MQVKNDCHSYKNCVFYTCLINNSGFKTVINVPRHYDNWAEIDRGPICKRCNESKLDHGYYLGAYQCMTMRTGVFIEKTKDIVHPPLTIKRRRKKTNG